MSDLPSDLDLKFLPDWLKESPTQNRYANYQGEAPSRGGGDRERGRSGPGRPGGPRNDRGGERRPGGGARPGQSRPGGGPGDRRDQRRDDRPRPAQGERRPESPRPPAAPLVPSVRVEFLPEPNGAAGIAKQIRSGTRAYPLFGTARLFLEKLERHRVRITSLDNTKPLFQIEDGPVSFDRAGLERGAFQFYKADYYKEEVVEGDPIKGNFANVARSRSTGAFLGPTNHHAYQPAMRKLYEERFSRRMSFSEFQHEEIVIVTDEQAIADWKEQARSSTTYTTLKEEEPKVFKTLAETEQHFRSTYLPQLVKSGVSLETSGEASRACSDRGIVAGLRESWEQERGFPGSIVHHLRPRLVEVGLHFFKHRKRVLYISPIRPQRHTPGELFSEGISAILGLVELHPRITRPQLATKLLGENYDTPEMLSKKAALASDLHYLIQCGNVIEFHDGTLDLPLSPKAESEAEKPDARRPQPAKKEASSKARPVEPAGTAAAETASVEAAPDQQSAEPAVEPVVSAQEAVEAPAQEAAEAPVEVAEISEGAEVAPAAEAAPEVSPEASAAE